MKEYKKYILLMIFTFFMCINNVFATTIRETLVSGDGYDTILPNTFIIGISKFSADEVLTASKATIAGAHDALFYYQTNGTMEGYQAPRIYYYLGSDIGWFMIDENNNAEPVNDAETLSKLSSIDIYYVNNIEKKIEINYDVSTINKGSLEAGVEVGNNTILVDATKPEFQIETTSGKIIKFLKDEDTNTFIEDTSECYTVENGIIIDYSDTCSKSVTVPKRINGELVTGIASNAFRGKNITDVTLPSSITSIGEGAFSENANLTGVTFKGKYDNTDFEGNIENAFDDNVEINYDNDLTRSLNALEDEYTIKIHSGFNIDNDNIQYVIYNEVFKEINKGNYSYHIEKSELTKYYMIHYYNDSSLNSGECYDHKENSFDIFFSTNGSGKYYIYFQKRANNCTRVITVNKELKINYETVNNSQNNTIVNRVVSELQRDNEASDNERVITRRNILENLIDENKLDYIFEPKTAQIVEPTIDDEIGGSITTGTLFLFKDNVLYKIMDNFVLKNLSNAYYPKISPDNYENMEDYTDAILASFTNKTNITDYSFVFRNESKRYIERTRGANKTYYIGLFDNDTLEYWSIIYRQKIKDDYDSNGYTKTSCFDFSNGTITGYNGNCGANVKIPNRINNQDVTTLKDSLFYGFGIKSIQLPNNLTTIGNYSLADNELTSITIPNHVATIGWGAFYKNKLESLTIPNSVITIDGEAFRSNHIRTLSLPDSIQILGNCAFLDNELDDNNAFIYERVYDETLGRYVIDNTKINSYAGRNRDNVIIPNNVKVIGTNAFQDLSLTKVTIPNTIETIETYAFANNNLTEVNIPSSLKILESVVFYNNSKLKNVTLHDGLEEIRDYAFYGTDIETISIPSTVKVIKEYALGYEIKTINVYGKESIEDFNELFSLYEDKIVLK